MIQKRRHVTHYFLWVTPGKGDKNTFHQNTGRSTVGTLPFCVPIIRAEAHLPCVTVTEPVPPAVGPFGDDSAPCCYLRLYLRHPGHAVGNLLWSAQSGLALVWPSRWVGHILAPLLCMHSVSEVPQNLRVLFPKPAFCLRNFQH